MILQPALLTVRQVAAALNVSRALVYEALRDGRIQGLRIGSRWRVPLEELQRLLMCGLERRAQDLQEEG
jgi:excisionase family DNA binding protein